MQTRTGVPFLLALTESSRHGGELWSPMPSPLAPGWDGMGFTRVLGAGRTMPARVPPSRGEVRREAEPGPQQTLANVPDATLTADRMRSCWH